MYIIRDNSELLAATLAEKRAGRSIGVVPTMGYLHAGHMSLVEACRKACDFVIVTDFVNPTQFGPNEDFDVYPRDEAHDLALCAKAGADLVFLPSSEGLYPNGAKSTWLEVGYMGQIYCGVTRPGHFSGVVSVVAKLIHLCRADFAFFGEKDYQQLAVVRRMVEDLCIPCEIVGLPTVRESDGLAMSSRNTKLSADARLEARVLYAALMAVKAAFDDGCRDSKELLWIADTEIMRAPSAEIQYIALADPVSLEALTDTLPDSVQMLMAVKIGGVRLIDNLRLEVI